MVFSVAIFLIGVLMIVYFSEKLVEATVGTSLGFGISTFLISVVFIGFDPENLGLGAVASYDGAAGIAVGTIIGSAMVAIALALGITAVFSPMKFEKVPMQIPLLQVAAVILFGVLSFDGLLSRLDGLILLAGYGLSVWYLIYLGRQGLEIRPTGETAEVLERDRNFNRWQSLAQLAGSLVAIIVGSDIVVWSSKKLVAGFGLTDTVFGITILALMVSIEEVARELPAAIKGRPEITFGNVVGSVLAFFLFNAGVIALVRPLAVGKTVFNFYLPFSLGVVLFVTYLMSRKAISRRAGILLILGYLLFFSWGYLN